MSAYDINRVYLVKVDQKVEPYIIREYTNLINSYYNVISHNELAYNSKWFFNQVATVEGTPMGWDIYEIHGSDKLMPYSALH